MGRFVKKLNNFTKDLSSNGPWLDFHYARGEHEEYF